MLHFVMNTYFHEPPWSKSLFYTCHRHVIPARFFCTVLSSSHNIPWVFKRNSSNVGKLARSYAGRASTKKDSPLPNSWEISEEFLVVGTIVKHWKIILFFTCKRDGLCIEIWSSNLKKSENERANITIESLKWTKRFICYAKKSCSILLCHVSSIDCILTFAKYAKSLIDK